MIVKNVLPAAKERLVTARDDASLLQVAALLRDRHVNLVVICNNKGVMTGVVSKTDIVSQISTCAGHACTTMVTSVMTQEIIYCRPDHSLRDTWSLMKDNGFINLPVVDQNIQPLGVLNARDVLQELLGEVEHGESLLRDYVMGVGYF